MTSSNKICFQEFFNFFEIYSDITKNNDLKYTYELSILIHITESMETISETDIKRLEYIAIEMQMIHRSIRGAFIDSI